MHARPTGNRHVRSWVCVRPPNKPMKLPVAFGARSLSATRWGTRSDRRWEFHPLQGKPSVAEDAFAFLLPLGFTVRDDGSLAVIVCHFRARGRSKDPCAKLSGARCYVQGAPSRWLSSGFISAGPVRIPAPPPSSPLWDARSKTIDFCRS